jgi:hypothetical protein
VRLAVKSAVRGRPSVTLAAQEPLRS